MKIEKIRLTPVSLPFAFDFSHAQRRRRSARNVVVEVVAEKEGISGFGEGAPRSYVTGETPASVAGHIAEAAADPAFPWELSDPDQIRRWAAALDRGRFGNAARCALELALFDALGRRRNRPIIDFFPADHRAQALCYGAALPMAEPDIIEKGCHIIRDLGIRRIKLKFGPELDRNRKTLETVAQVFADDCELKVDVNFAWNFSIALAHIGLLTDHRVGVVEQPLPHQDPDGAALAAAYAAENIVVMADESACTLADLDTICRERSFGMINMRLSKCGGFTRSLEMIDARLIFAAGKQDGGVGLHNAPPQEFARIGCIGDFFFYGRFGAASVGEPQPVGRFKGGGGDAVGSAGDDFPDHVRATRADCLTLYCGRLGPPPSTPSRPFRLRSFRTRRQSVWRVLSRIGSTTKSSAGFRSTTIRSVFVSR
jgi:muconate cycloisomerase